MQPGFFSKFCSLWGQMTLNSSSTCNQNSSHSRAHTTGCVWKYLKGKCRQRIVPLVIKHYPGICLAPKLGKPPFSPLSQSFIVIPISEKKEGVWWNFFTRMADWRYLGEERDANRACVRRWPKSGWKDSLRRVIKWCLFTQINYFSSQL